MPSLRELFNIMEYFDLTPTLFFAPMDDPDSPVSYTHLDVYKRQGVGDVVHQPAPVKFLSIEQF